MVKSGYKTESDNSYSESHAPVIKKSFSGNMGQLVVLLTGISLTLILYLFVTTVIETHFLSEQDRALIEAQAALGESVSGLKNPIETIAALSALSYQAAQKPASPEVLSQVADIERYDRIFILTADGNGGWRAQDIYRSQDFEPLASIFTPGREESLIKYLPQTPHNQLAVVSDLPGSNYTIQSVEPLIKTKPVLVSHPVAVGRRLFGYIIGVARMGGHIDQAWLSHRPGINVMVIRSADTGQPFFFMGRNGEGPVASLSSDKVKMAMLGPTAWEAVIRTGAGTSTSGKMLKQIPLLILVFGSILTGVGTFYVRNSQKQFLRLLGMNRALAQKNFDLNLDFSETNRSNEALRRAEQKYRTIFDAINDVIFEIAADGTLLFLNQTWQRVSGFDPKESLERCFFSYFHPNDQSFQREQFAKLLSGQKTSYLETVRLKTVSGAYRAVELSISMLRQDKGHNLRAVGTLTDVEERTRAEKALSEAEKKYREIVENAAGGIYQMTREGQFISANPAVAHILGYSSATEMMDTIKDVNEGLYLDRAARVRFLRTLLPGGDAKTVELRGRRKDGATIWLYENIRAVTDKEGGIDYYEGSMEDITQRKETELKLREAKIQSDLASRAKSEFLANMSHELRTPLNAIIGFSEIIKNEVLGAVENKQYLEYIKDIHQSGNRLLSIINEILDVSHIEAGERQLNEEVIDIRILSDNCIDFLASKIKLNNVKVINNLPQDKDSIRLLGEELAIKQVFLNLLSNAIKFTPEEGLVTLSCEVEKSGDLRLSVTDTGVGLDEVEVKKALSPFGQIETSLSRGTSSGVGLGLTLVNSLVDLHGGKLELFSQKGIGTTATVTFPARRVVPEEPEGGGDKHEKASRGSFVASDLSGLSDSENIQ